MRYPETPGWKGQAETGREAALAYAAEAKGRRRQVLNALIDYGPATAEQLSEKIGLHWYLIRPRLSELKSLGYVADSGERGRGALGGRVVSWRVKTDEEREAEQAAQAEAPHD